MASSSGMNPSITRDPELVGIPLTWMTSLMEIGIPWSGLLISPAAFSASNACACFSNESSESTYAKAFNSG